MTGLLFLAAVLLPGSAFSASTAGKEPVPFGHSNLSPMASPLTTGSGFESPLSAAGSPWADPQNHPLLAGPYHSGAAIDVASGPSVAESDDDAIRPDPRPRMKKFMLIVLVLGALVKYLTSPSYLKFVSEVTDPWAS